jgi:hypothetical protein
MPYVLLPVGAEDAAIVGDEVCRVVDAESFFPIGFSLMSFDDAPRDEADLELLCEGLVGG